MRLKVERVDLNPLSHKREFSNAFHLGAENRSYKSRF